MKKITALISGACLAAVLALPLSAGAIELTIEKNKYYLGSANVVNEANADKEYVYIDTLRGMEMGLGTINLPIDYSRSENDFGDLPAAAVPWESLGPKNQFELPKDCFYLLAKYEPKQGTGIKPYYSIINYVWVVSDLNGKEVSFAGKFEINGTYFNLTDTMLFNAKPDGSGVPDGGLTLMLLGSGLTGLVALRRKLG
ncbi:MAG: VPDSG-CTERM sorting domain-containing protein [Verrucomicrobia bacterium]|jgi:hypothetical protein|nr:VPDSG-CTERM sorting domain-containing protein [Verrucomicrobiota bacterium]